MFIMDICNRFQKHGALIMNDSDALAYAFFEATNHLSKMLPGPFLAFGLRNTCKELSPLGKEQQQQDFNHESPRREARYSIKSLYRW